MKDDDEEVKWYEVTPSNPANYFYELFEKQFAIPKNKLRIGVDWVEDSGMNRGDVIKREGNVIYARFETVELANPNR